MGCDCQKFSNRYIYGKLNKELKEKEYKGGETETAKVNIDNKTNTIYVNVKGDVFLGDSGSVTLEASKWVEGTYTINPTDLKDTDAIFFYPNTIDDKTNAEDAELFVSTSGTTIIFSAQNTPSVDITFNYFIARGK